MQFAMARGFDAGFVLELDGAHEDAVERGLATSGNACESFYELQLYGERFDAKAPFD